MNYCLFCGQIDSSSATAGLFCTTFSPLRPLFRLRLLSRLLRDFGPPALRSHCASFSGGAEGGGGKFSESNGEEEDEDGTFDGGCKMGMIPPKGEPRSGEIGRIDLCTHFVPSETPLTVPKTVLTSSVHLINYFVSPHLRR